jgi:hypothetical protein
MDNIAWSDVLFRSTLRDIQKDRFSPAANARATERAWRHVEKRYSAACSKGRWLLFCEAIRAKLHA